MGLFRKNPAEKKLKELTGGFILSTEFTRRLVKQGLKIQDGNKIQQKLKEEIKQGLSAEEVPIRLNALIVECKKQKNIPDSAVNFKKCPKCGTEQENDNTFCVNCGHDFSFKYSPSDSNSKKPCPNCHIEQDSSNTFCIYCGHDFTTKKLKEFKKTCPVCRKKQNSDNNICINCGYDFLKKRKKVQHKECPECGRKLFKKTMVCPDCHYDFKLGFIPDAYLKCPNCGESISRDTEICSNCNYSFKDENPMAIIELNDFKKRISFLNSYDFNLKKCHICNTNILRVDPFCFNCGAAVLTNETVKNKNLEVKDGKLVAKNDAKKDDELSSLEDLYSQTVKSKYAPSFKIAYTLYLEQFKKNPLKKFSDKTARKYETTLNKLKKQALEDKFIEIASPLAAAKDAKVSELKEILKKYDLKVSGKKDELIERLGENLTDDELKKYFKSKNYQISDKGLEFLENNNYILYIYNNPDVSRVFYPSEINRIFEEKHYSVDEIQDRLIEYLKKIFDEKLTQELWVDFKSYANAIAFIHEDKNELKDALDLRIKVFLFDLNNYSIVLNKPEPVKTKLKKKDVSKLNGLLHNLTLPIDELKELFEKSYNEVLFKMIISKDDALIYLLKVFGGEDLEIISKEINESYSNPY